MKNYRLGKIFVPAREDVHDISDFIVGDSNEDNSLNAKTFCSTQPAVRSVNTQSEGLCRSAFLAQDNPQ